METKVLKPTAERFFGVLVLSVTTLFAFRAVFDLVSSDSIEIADWWLPMLLLATGTAVGVTIGSRKHQLSINDTDLTLTKERILESLAQDGLRTRGENGNETILEPSNGFNRLFNCWFGLELTRVDQVDNGLVVEAPSRRVEGLRRIIGQKE